MVSASLFAAVRTDGIHDIGKPVFPGIAGVHSSQFHNIGKYGEAVRDRSASTANDTTSPDRAKCLRIVRTTASISPDPQNERIDRNLAIHAQTLRTSRYDASRKRSHRLRRGGNNQPLRAGRRRGKDHAHHWNNMLHFLLLHCIISRRTFAAPPMGMRPGTTAPRSANLASSSA